MGEESNNLYDINVTMVSNAFLKDYLAEADPFYIKVYLYYLWQRLDKIDIHKAADDLNLTDNDVERAIKYWVSKKVFVKDIVKKEEVVTKNLDNLVSFKEKKEELMSKKDGEQALNELIFFAEKVLPNTISSKQLEALQEMYNVMKLPVEVIEYLIEYLAQTENYNYKYMMTIANSWYEQGIKTKNEAKAFTEKFGKDKKVKKSKVARRRSSLENDNDNYSSNNEISLDSKDIFK